MALLSLLVVLFQDLDPVLGCRLKRVILIGDHHQLPPVVKSMAFQKYSKLDQSLFTRFVRLGTPTVEVRYDSATSLDPFFFLLSTYVLEGRFFPLLFLARNAGPVAKERGITVDRPVIYTARGTEERSDQDQIQRLNIGRIPVISVSYTHLTLPTIYSV